MLTYRNERLEYRRVDVHADDIPHARENLEAAEELALCAAKVDNFLHHADVLGVFEDGADALISVCRKF